MEEESCRARVELRSDEGARGQCGREGTQVGAHRNGRMMMGMMERRQRLATEDGRGALKRIIFYSFFFSFYFCLFFYNIYKF